MAYAEQYGLPELLSEKLNMAADTAPCAQEIHSLLPLSRKLGNVKARQSIQSLFSVPQQRRLRKNILAWYDLHRRDLPWRASRDPYRVCLLYTSRCV